MGLVARQWNSLIESIMSHTFSSFPISKQYADLHQLLQGTTQDECQDKLLGFKVFLFLFYVLLMDFVDSSICWEHYFLREPFEMK